MFHRTTWIQGHLIPLLFGASMAAFGCENFGAKMAGLSAAYDSKISAPTTQTAMAVGQTAGVIAAAAPGTPVGNAAGMVLVISGAILALDRIISATLKTAANISSGKPIDSPGTIAASNSNEQNEPSKGGKNTT